VTTEGNARVRLEVVARTDVGRVRSGNEDAFLVDDGADTGDAVRLIAVADGMGGHQAGEVASATAIAALVDSVRGGQPVDEAITGANAAVFSKAAEDVALRGMGTTMTAAVIEGDALVIGHVGDSRAYLLHDGDLRQLTTDHSVIAELIAAGELSEDEAEMDPRRAMITRALGIDPDVEVDLLDLDVVPGDRLLLCSDGLTTMVRDDAIADVLRGESDRERVAEQLVAAANAAGGADNITVVVADVVSDDSGAPVLPAAPAPAAPPDPDDDPTETLDPVDEPTAATGVTAPGAPAPGTRRRRWWRRRAT
jgi:serine/threonine protein phosphatase PrpC